MTAAEHRSFTDGENAAEVTVGTVQYPTHKRVEVAAIDHARRSGAVVHLGAPQCREFIAALEEALRACGDDPGTADPGTGSVREAADRAFGWQAGGGAL